MTRRPRTPDQVLVVLCETPERIAALTSGVSAPSLHAAPSEGEWSVNEVLAHLRSCADVWGGCIATIVAEEAAVIRAVNPTAWITETDYPDLPFEPSFQAFTTQRGDLLALLEPLPPEAWARTATVTGAGKPLPRTVLDYADRMARHEREHWKQIERTLAIVQR